MMQKIPCALRIDPRLLIAVIALPLVAAVVIAGGVMAMTPVDVVAEAGGPVAFALGFAKFCYLAVAAAHLGHGLAERTDGGPADPAWWWPQERGGAGPRGRRAAETPYWHIFPNHFDGAGIALAITLALTIVL